jgi:hypothetical protein
MWSENSSMWCCWIATFLGRKRWRVPCCFVMPMHHFYHSSQCQCVGTSILHGDSSMTWQHASFNQRQLWWIFNLKVCHLEQ